MTELNRPTFHARADERERVHEFRVNVALHHLRRNRRGFQSQFFADEFFERGRQMRARADRAGKFSDGNNVTGTFKTLQRAAKFIVHERHFKPNVVGSPWMPWLRPMHGVNLYSFARRAMTGRSFFTSAIKMSALWVICTAYAVSPMSLLVRPKWSQREARVVDLFGDGGGEADDIVVENFLQFLGAFGQSFCIGETFFRAAFHLGEVGARHDALLDERFAGEQFDLQPDAELVFVRPDGPHFGAGVT
jgi:hypothetical protein